MRYAHAISDQALRSVTGISTSYYMCVYTCISDHITRCRRSDPMNMEELCDGVLEVSTTVMEQVFDEYDEAEEDRLR